MIPKGFDEWFWFIIGLLPIWIFLFLIIASLASCAHNPCIDNPRNMQCMTAQELDKEL